MKKEVIFIAGHNGMVGSAIHDKLNSDHRYLLKTCNRKELDLTNQEKVYAYFAQNSIDIMIIAAARVGGIKANISYPAEFITTNLQIQNNLFEAARKYGIKKIIFLGSSCIYPKECPQPMKEEYLLTGPLEPTNEGYALAKIVGLKMAKYYELQYNISSICLMPCNLYGKNDSFDPNHSHVLSALIKKFSDAVINNSQELTMWGTGIARREFMNVADLSNIIAQLIEDWSGSNEEFINIGTGTDISIKDLALLIANKVGYKGKILWDKSKPDGMLKKCLDISKMNDLGLSTSISLEEGIDEMILNYKEVII